MKLTKEEIKQIPKSFDIVGSILIFSEFPKKLLKKAKNVGEHLIKKNKQVKAVAIKSKAYSGKYRTTKLKIIAGEKRKETIHKENGVLIKINPEKVYFSPRTGSERLRVARLIKKSEIVLVMFSGAMPFGLTISKHSKAKEIYGIEINPIAHEYARENISINKIKNIKLYNGDVRKVLPKIKKKFNRIIMPHPTEAGKYLSLALKYLKKNGMIHLYLFEKEENFLNLIKDHKKKFKSVKLTKCGSPAPGKYRICLDLKM